MNDREYIKLNTSIQTASNASTVVKDEEGNLEAKIELRLPDNIFGGNSGPRKIEKVEMLTTKFRLSMEETPIAQIPLKEQRVLNGTDLYISSCEMDVYPFSFTGINTIEPHTEYPDDIRVFQSYKEHYVEYRINLAEQPTKSLGERADQTIFTMMNTNGAGVSKDNMFYELLTKAGILEKTQNHLMNLAITKGYHKVSTNDGGDKIVVYDVSGIEQMLADAFANAITFAATEIHTIVNVGLCRVTDAEYFPGCDPTNFVEIDGVEWCYWRYDISVDNQSGERNLRNEFKPQVSIDESTLTISYDTAAFRNIVPILWNTSFIQNYERAIQTLADDFLRNIHMPPVKRQYQYGVTTTTNPNQYMYSLLENIQCGVLNIIANKTMKDTLSFLPWITIDFKKIAENNPQPSTYHVVERNSFKAYKAYTNIFVTTTATRESLIQHYGYDHTDREYGQYLPEYGKFIIYIYDLDVGDADVPERRKKQLILLGGEAAEERIDINAGSAVYTPQNVDWQQTESPPPQIIREYEDDSPSYPLGVNLIYTSGSFDERIIRSNTYPEEEWQVWKLCNGDSGQVVTLPTQKYPTSTWRDNTDTDMPPLQEPFDVIRLPDPGVNIHQYMRTYMLPQEQTDNFDMFYFPRIIRQENYTEGTQTIAYNEIVVEEKSGEFDPYITPNLTDYTDTFYALDGTTCEVNIGTQEPVVNGELFKITTSKTNSNALKHTAITASYGSLETPNRTNWRRLYGVNLIIPDENIYYKRVLYLVYDYDPEDPTTHLEQGVYTGGLYPGEFGSTIDGIYTTYKRYAESVAPPPDEDPTVTYSDDTSLTPGTSTGTLNKSVDYETSKNQEPISSLDESNEYFCRVRLHPENGWVPRTDGEGYNEYSRAQTLTGDIKQDTDLRIYPKDWPADKEIDISLPINNRRRKYQIWFFAEPGYYMFIGTKEGTVFEEISTYKEYRQTVTQVIEENPEKYIGNVRLSFTWKNLPIVVLSPIQSIVLTLAGMKVTQEIQPINMTSKTGSSLISTVPIIENYFSMAQTLRDLHDELVVVKETFDDMATYTLAVDAGQERSITLAAKYIAKDGTLHQIYIPPNGIFSLQLTFAISYFIA